MFWLTVISVPLLLCIKTVPYEHPVGFKGKHRVGACFSYEGAVSDITCNVKAYTFR